MPATQSLSCTGSLGDPVVTISSGAGPDFGPALASGITSMQYVRSFCPNDGEYTIVNSSSGCFGDSWHSIRDHTGDANGYFMLINASLQPSDFYTQTVTGLCSGTTYRFSAFIMNVLRLQAFLPNITFTIEKADGTVLQSYNTGDLPNTSQPVYNEFGFYFTTPPGISTVVLRMRNNGVGGIGNDLAIDDISFSPAGPQSVISISGITGDTLSVCNQAVRLQSLVEPCFLSTEYQWQTTNNNGQTWVDIPGETSNSYTTPVLTSGVHQYRLTVAQSGNIVQSNCRVNSNVFTILSPGRQPEVFDTLITRCPGGFFTLPWGTTVSTDGMYSDTAKTEFGCDSLIRRYRFRIQQVSRQNLRELVCSGLFYELPSGIRVFSPGNYVDTVRSVIEQCDSIITNLQLDTIALPVLAVSKSNDINCLKAVTRLQAMGAASYSWSPAGFLDDPLSSNPVAAPPGTTIFYVRGRSANGCEATDSIIVFADRAAVGEIFRMPNSFTPNQDGLNDCFGASFMGYTSGFSMVIYDRWGKQVFKTDRSVDCWDGTYRGRDCPTGTYVYYIAAKTPCGPVQQKGTILLLK